MPYPNFSFNEDYIETPSTTKQGLIIPVTKEAILYASYGHAEATAQCGNMDISTLE